METDKPYLIVGVFVAFVIVSLGLFTVWLVRPHDDQNYREYRIRFAESVSGLDVGGSVKFRGVNVGRVESITIDPVDTRLIRVDVSLLKNTPVKTDTVAGLKMQGVTGVVFVELSGGSPGAPLLADTWNDEESPPLIRAESSGINAIVNIMPEILQKISTISDQIGKLVSDENITTVQSMMHQWEEISTALNAQTGQMKKLLENSTQVTGDLHDVIAGSKDNIQKLLDNLNETSKQLTQLISGANGTAESQYQEAYQLINELKKTAREVRELTSSLNENPSQVIRPAQEKGVPAP